MYKLRVADGLKKGQSLAIRTFGMPQVVRYDEEPLADLQQYFAENLQDEIQKLKRFSDTKIISEPGPHPADLVLEGSFTGIDEGSRAQRIIPDSQGYATVTGSGVIERTSDGEKVLEFSCISQSLGGPIGLGGLLARGGKPMIHSGSRSVARQIAQTIVMSDKKPSATKKRRFTKEVRAR